MAKSLNEMTGLERHQALRSRLEERRQELLQRIKKLTDEHAALPYEKRARLFADYRDHIVDLELRVSGLGNVIAFVTTQFLHALAEYEFQEEHRAGTKQAI